jgi:hypothetical protein
MKVNGKRYWTGLEEAPEEQIENDKEIKVDVSKKQVSKLKEMSQKLKYHGEDKDKTT